jgi:hypothetical protein
VRKVLTLAATLAVCLALSSCTEPSSVSAQTSRMASEPPARIERAPLPPPVGYASATSESPMAVARSGNSRDYPVAEASTPGKWRSSPRWAAIRGQGCIVVEQHAQSKLAKPDNAEVQNCSKEDAGQEVSASQSPAEKLMASPRAPEPVLPSESDDYSPAPPTSEDQSDGAIESWTGAI